MSQIAAVHGRQILDSQGHPTIEVEVSLDSGVVQRSAAPSGVSTGRLERPERRDGGNRWSARGVTAAVQTVHDRIAPGLVGLDPVDQSGVDEALQALDDVPQTPGLGSNAMLATSLAVARAAARDVGAPLWRYLGGEGGLQLPVPLLDVINGGIHAENQLSFEEFLIVPAGARSFSDALRMAAEVFHQLRFTLLADGRGAPLGGGGGYAPDLESGEYALQVLISAITTAGYEPGREIWLGVDAAGSQLSFDGGYSLAHEGWRASTDELIDYYDHLSAHYPLLVLEDGLGEDDWEGWRRLTARLGDRVELAGDDVFATRASQLRRGIHDGIGNAIVIKPNQVGTLTEALETISLANAHGYATVIAHRAGETEDTTICDLAVATRSSQLKAGAPARERVAKYNRLLRIEEALGEDAVFPGIAAFARTQ